MARRHRLGSVLAWAFVAASIVPWLFPSDVLKLVADRRDVLLGRYSLGWLSTLLAITALLWLSAFAAWSLRKRSAREVAFPIAAGLLAILAAGVVVDVAGRLGREPRYLERRVEIPGDEPEARLFDVVRHRPPGVSLENVYRDVPPTARSFPSAPPGHPPVAGRLTTDARGFRNRDRRERYEILAIGDSFVEGAQVDDEETWPEVLERVSGRSVYNLGVGGSEPGHYLTALLAFGLALDPQVVIVMLYEGNDFMEIADSRFEDEDVFASSPVVGALGRLLVRSLGPVRADAPVPGGEILSWMPVAVPAGPGARSYAFRPKRLLQLHRTREEFAASPEWADTAKILRGIHAVCSRRGIRLVLAYAPSKAHVVMPLVADRVPHEQLHAFVSLKRRDLPDPEAFARELYARLENPERVVREFAAAEGIELVSATEPLRAAVAAGDQAYFTYDPHWTPLGHERVALELKRRLDDPSGSAGATGP